MSAPVAENDAANLSHESSVPERYPELILDLAGVVIFGLLLFFLFTPSITRYPAILIGWCAAMLFAFEAARHELADARGEWIAWRLLFWALVLRMPFFIVPTDGDALLSGDVYRYLWEGKVVREGANPYISAPDDPELAFIARGDANLHALVEHRSIPAIYPPLAQILFSLAPADRFSFRKLICALDLLLVLLLLRALSLRRLPEGRLAGYALLPLPAIEAAGQGHFDSLIALSLTGAGVFALRGGAAGAGALVAVAAGLKYYAALALLPVLLAVRRAARRRTASQAAVVLGFVAIASVSTLPFLSRGGIAFEGLRVYAERWEFNAPLFDSVRLLLGLAGIDDTGVWARVILWTCAASLAIASGSLIRDPFAAIAATIAAVLVCSPVLYPWYLLAVVPLFVLIDETPWSTYIRVLAITSLLSYEVLAHRGEWVLSWWMLAIEQGVPLAAALLLWVSHRRDRASGAPTRQGFPVRTDDAPGTISPA